MGCGSKEHGAGRGLLHETHCPASNTKCGHCGILWHLEQVCRQKINIKPVSHATTTNNILASGNTPFSTSWFFAKRSVDDFTYDNLEKNKTARQCSGMPLSNSNKVHERILVPLLEWVPPICHFVHRLPPQLPNITVGIEVLTDIDVAFNHPITAQLKETTIKAILDTGAQACACGPEMIRKIGVSEEDLVPTSHKINGVKSSSMDIAGVLFATLSANGLTSKQVIYVGRNIQGLFL